MNEPVRRRPAHEGGSGAGASRPGRYAAPRSGASAGRSAPGSRSAAQPEAQRRRPTGAPPQRKRRKRRNPYARLARPALIFGLLLTLLILVLVDYNSYELKLQLPEDFKLEYGREVATDQLQAVLQGGLFGSDESATVQLAQPVDTRQLGQVEVSFDVRCESSWLIFPRSFQATVTKTLEVVDTTPPQITLTTSEVPTNLRGTSYREEGYTAIDLCDGDVTSQVTSRQEGDQVFYTVTDSSGNTATAVRDIVYMEGAESNGKTIYLTFDDGPGKYTEKLLDILGKYNVKATFFVVNTDYVHLISDIVAEGHSIAVHSYTHEFKKIYQSEEAFFQDVEKIQDVIVQYAGERTNLLRFPGGSSNTQSDYNKGIMTRLSKEVGNRGYYYFDWNIDSDDAGRAKTAEKVFQNVTKGIEGKDDRNSFIVLQHDIKEFSVDAVEDIILWGLENGYTFLPLDETSPGSHHKIFN